MTDTVRAIGNSELVFIVNETELQFSSAMIVHSVVFVSTGISQPYRIDIFEDYIYGTGLKHEVFKIHKFGKQSVEFLSLGVEKPTNVLMSHRFKQQDGRFPWTLILLGNSPVILERATTKPAA